MCEAIIVDVVMDVIALAMTVFIIAAVWGTALVVSRLWHRWV